MLDKIGADKVIYPERDMGIRVGHNLADSNIVDYIELVDNLSIMEIGTPKTMVGKSLSEVELRRLYNVTVVALRRNGQILVNPDPNDKIKEGDIMVILGTRDNCQNIGVKNLRRLITSVNNQLVKETSELKIKKYRTTADAFIIEGARSTEEVLKLRLGYFARFR